MIYASCLISAWKSIDEMDAHLIWFFTGIRSPFLDWTCKQFLCQIEYSGKLDFDMIARMNYDARKMPCKAWQMSCVFVPAWRNNNFISFIWRRGIYFIADMYFFQLCTIHNTQEIRFWTRAFVQVIALFKKKKLE